MLDLPSLVFKTDTKELKDAFTDIQSLGKAMDDLSKKSEKLSTSAEKVTKVTKKSANDLSDANREVADSADNTNKILERQQTILEYQAKGFSKGQASTLAYAKAVGATTTELEQLGKVLQTQRTLMGNDPFDKSLGSLKSLQNELKVLKDVQRQYTAELDISSKQMKDLSLDRLRLIEISKIDRKSLSDLKKSMRELNQEYTKTAQEINRLKDAQAASDKAKKDSANANSYLARELERVQYATSELNSELNRSTANSLLKFEKALKQSGLTVDEQKQKLDAYRTALMQMDKTSSKKNTDYISRAIGPQITDIVVGLSTGQSLMTVMLQQGGQLRDQFALAGVAAGEMGTMMRTAAKEMVGSIAAVAGAFGNLLVGSILDAGKAVVSTAAKFTGLSSVIEYARYQLTLFAMSGEKGGVLLYNVFDGLSTLLSVSFAGAILASTVALIALGSAFTSVIKQEAELSRNLELTGASLGLTKGAAIDLAKSLTDADHSTSKIITTISALAKQSGFAKDDINIVTKAMIDMERYGKVSIESSAKELEKLQDKPAQALAEVAAKTGLVSKATQDHVRDLIEQGRKADAATVAMQAWADSSSQAAKSIKENMSPLEQVWDNILVKVNQVVGAIQNMVRASSTAEKIASVQADIKKLQTGFFTETFGMSPRDKKLLEDKKFELMMLNMQATAEEEISKKKETQAKYSQFLVDNAKALEKQYSKDEMFGQKRKAIEEAVKNKIIDQEIAAEALAGWKRIIYGQDKKAKELKESYSPVSDNSIQQLQKIYSSELSLAQNLSKDKLAVLKSEFDSGMMMRYEYNDKVNQALEASENKQFEVIQKNSDAILAAYHARGEQLVAEFQSLSAKDKANPKNIEKFTAAFENLNNAQAAFQEQVDNTKKKLSSDIFTRQTENLNQHKKAIFEITEAYREFAKSEDLIAEQRKREKVLNEQLRWASPEQAAYIKASAAETERLVQAEKKLADAVHETNRKYKESLERDVSGTARADAYREKIAAEEAYQKAVADNAIKIQQAGIDAVIEYQRNQLAEFANGISDALATALFEGGKAGSKKLRDVIIAELKKPIVVIIQAVINAVFGGLTGSLTGSLAGGAANSIGGSLLGNPLGSIASSLTGNFFGSGSLAALGSNFGAGIVNGLVGGGTVSQGIGLMGAGSTAGGFGTILGAAAPWALAGLAIANGLGLFKKTKKVGGGLMGTLGQEGGIHNYDLMRRSGSLFSGPSYSYRDTGISELDKEIQASFLQSRKGIVDMGKVLGFDTSKLANFTTQLGTDIIHPDTGGRGIKLDGLSQEEAQKKINEALLAASDEMAQQILGTWETTTEQVSKVINEFIDADSGAISRTIEETITNTRYVASEYAKDGEKAIDTLTRLATSLGTVNGIFENLGVTLYETSLKGADAASKLIDAFGGLEEFVKTTTTFYDRFYSEQEKYNNTQRELNDLFAEYGLKLPKNKDEFKALVNAQDLSTESGRKVYAALMKIAGAFADMTDLGDNLADKEKQRIEEEQKQREEALKQLREAYIKQRKEALQAQIKITEDQINNLQKIFDALSDGIKKLYGQVDQTAQMQIDQARQVINTAVTSRTLPDAATLQDAIGTVTGGFDKSNYKSKVDADRDRLRFAAQLDDLRGIADKELKAAKNTFDLLKLQLDALDNIQVIDKKQLDSLISIDGGIADIVDALGSLPENLSSLLLGGTGSGGGTGGSGTPGRTGTGGPLLITGGGSNPKVNYSAQEALTSFDKFQAWYKGVVSNPANPMMNENYKVPDWLRVSGELGGRASTPEELFGRYLFFKNNPEYASDFETIFGGGTSKFSTSGKDLVKSDLSKMPTEVAEYFKNNTDSLLSYEGSGLDPVLGYQLYKYGPEYFGLDPKKNNFTDFLRNNKWTPEGIVANRNVIDYSNANYAGGYKLSKYDTTTGNVVDINGQIYTQDGKLLGTASQSLMEEIYGKDYIRNTGRQYGDKKRSALYNSNINAGLSEEHYYSELRKGLDKAITDGMTAQQLTYFMRDHGVSIDDAAIAYNVTPDEIRRNLRNGGATDIPAFAKGGNYAGGVAIAGENGPELINFNTGGYVHTASQSRDILSQNDVVECLEVISAKVDKLEAAAISTAVSNNKIAKLLDRVTPDGNAFNVNVV